MAEPPTEATRLLDADDYAGFADHVARCGWARSDARTIARESQQVQVLLRAARRPPGPTSAWLTLLRLVQTGHIDAAVLEAT